MKAGLAAAYLLALTSAMGQYGASPSTTSLFFDDLRARSKQSEMDSNSGVRDGAVTYDYERGAYVGTEEERLMGEGNSVYQSNEAARQMGQPAARAGSSAFAARSAGDYTNYSGQYGAPSSFFAPTYVSDPFLGGKRNVQVGPVNVGFGAFGSVEYNDNVTRAPDGQELSDVISTVLLNIDANYQVTQNNRLSITTAVGFDHYFEHPEVSPYGGDFVLNVLPGSTIAFDIKAGPVYITIYDRLSVRPGVQNDFALSANQIFGVFQNDAGIAAMWEINSQVTLSLNYLHSNAIALEDEFAIFDRDMDTISGNLTWSPSGTWSLGLEGSMSWVRYPQQFNNDGQLANMGVVFATPIGDSTFLRAAAGYQVFNFDDPPDLKRTVSEGDIQETQNAITAVQRTLASGQVTTQSEIRRLGDLQNELQGLLARQFLIRQQEDADFNANSRDNSDLSDYYYNVTLTNQLSARVTQVLSFGHESALNNVSNFITADYVTYGISIIAWRGSRISLSGYYEDADMSGGLAAEDLTQHGFDVYWNHQLSSTIRFGVGYHYGTTDSEFALRDFDQHAISADISFALSPKATLSLGYRYFTTDAQSELLSFDQNRFVMALNYNF